MAYCLPQEHLKPFLIIIPGIYIQYWIVTLISSKTDSSPKDELLLNDKATGRTSIKATAIEYIKMAVRFWQSVSMAMILVLDIWHFVEYHTQNGEISWWHQYNCFVEIVVNSSNFKTVLTYIMFYNMLFNSDLNDEMSIKILKCVVVISSFMVYPVIFTHWFPAVVCYCWIILAAALIYAFFYGVLYVCLVNKIKGHRVYSSIFGLGYFQDLEIMLEEYDGNMDKMVDDKLMKAPMFLILLIIGVFLIPVLSQSYWYSGQWNYIDSFVEVMTERSLKRYFNDLADEFVPLFQFITTVL